MYDVIVIGAGPCGCAAARALSENGLKVLLLEKSKLPRYKSCSGVLIEKSIRLVERYFSQSVPASVCCEPVQNRGMIFTDDNGREYRFESRGMNIWRDKFDRWLCELAKESGAQIKDQSTVTSIQEIDDAVCVSVNGKNEYSRFAVDCSGAVGINKSLRDSVITYQTYNDGAIDLDAHYFYAYLQPRLSGYDAWFNVKDGMLVLGVASTDPKELANRYGNFIAYMKEKHNLVIKKELRTDKWIIRNVLPPFDIDYGKSGILKAGENAGFLNPMGEGISSALESGHCAAQAIIENFDNKPNAVDEYKRKVARTKDYMIRQWQLVGRMSEKFSFMKER